MKRIILTALAVAVLAAGTLHAQSPKTLSTTGVVKAVSKDSLTVAVAKRDVAFVVTPTTRTIGKGLGRDLLLRQRTLVDVVKPGDRVTVAYHVSVGELHAVEVRRLR